MPLHFKRYDKVAVDGYVGYVNCICIASKSHLHPTTPSSYFTLTIEGTQGTKREVNVLIFRRQWSSVKLIQSHVESAQQNSDPSIRSVRIRDNTKHAEGALLEL